MLNFFTRLVSIRISNKVTAELTTLERESLSNWLVSEGTAGNTFQSPSRTAKAYIGESMNDVDDHEDDGDEFLKRLQKYIAVHCRI